ncbi:MAG: hypothetical protein ACYC0Q_07585 [Eubacteriales bacterium]|nr:hypothetical protein [Bacillota bacterium]
MTGAFSWKPDEKVLSRKYRTNVGRLIRAWKKGLSDREIAARLGVKSSVLYLIRQDLTLAHTMARLEQKNKPGQGF